MWPSSQGGVSIGYGHDGSGLYLPNVSPDRPWQFARGHGLGYRFYDIGSNRTVVPPVKLIQEFKSRRTKHSVYKQLRDSAASDVFVPSELMANYSFESSSIISPNGYDPTQGSLMDLGVLSSSHSDIIDNEDDSSDNEDNDIGGQGIAFVDGASGGTELAVAKLDYVKKRFIHGDNNNTATNMQQSNANVPMLQSKNFIDLGSPIQQVQFAPNPEPSTCPYVLVRTNIGTSLVKANMNTVSSSEVNLEIGPGFPFGDDLDKMSSASIVHSTFNAWNWTQTAQIDTLGGWNIFQLDDSGIFRSTSSGGPHKNELQHISKWNRMLWGSTPDSILIANRKHVRYHDLRSNDDNIQLLTQPDNLTNICDIAPSPLNNNENFVLTSDKLIWTDNRVPGKSLLSWDHFLHSKDPSLKLSACEINEVAVLSLYSQLLPANVVYQFTHHNGLPVSADDPYYYVTSPDSVTQSMNTFQLDLNQEELPSDEEIEDSGDGGLSKILCCMRLSTEHGLYRHILSTDKDSRLESAKRRVEMFSESEADDFIPSHSDVLYGDDYINTGKKTKDLYLYDFRNIYKTLFDIEKELPSEENHDEDGVQIFAETLNNAIKETFRQKKKKIYTLGEVATPNALLNDLSVASQMIEDLQSHYSNTKISIFPLTYGLNTLFDEKLKNIADIYQHLTKLWVGPLDSNLISNVVIERKEKICRWMATELALACMGYHHAKVNEEEDKEDSATAKEADSMAFLTQYTDSKCKTKLTQSVNLLLNEWPEDNESSQSYLWRPLGKEIELEEEPRQSMMLDSGYIPPPPSLSQGTLPTAAAPAGSLPVTMGKRSQAQSNLSLGSPSAKRTQSQKVTTSHNPKTKKKRRTQGF